jgi:hypothetical protein
MGKNNSSVIATVTEITKKISENLIVASGDVGVYVVDTCSINIHKIGMTTESLVEKFSEERFRFCQEEANCGHDFDGNYWWKDKNLRKDLVFVRCPRKFDDRTVLIPLGSTSFLKTMYMKNSVVYVVVGYRLNSDIFFPHPDPLKRIRVKFGEGRPELRWVWKDSTIAAFVKAAGATDISGTI